MSIDNFPFGASISSIFTILTNKTCTYLASTSVKLPLKTIRVIQFLKDRDSSSFPKPTLKIGSSIFTIEYIFLRYNKAFNKILPIV